MFDVHQLTVFLAVAEKLSFTRAAEELHLTHGAVSHQVRALEEHLGAPLFARHGKRVALTGAGRAFAERVRAALGDIAQAAEQLRARRDDRLTVSVLPSFASRWLMPRLIRFMDAHPQIEVTVIAGTALANCRDDEVDVAIRFGMGPWAPHVCEEFLRDEYFPVASPKWNKGKLPRAPKDLLDLRIIREDRDYWTPWFEAAGVNLLLLQCSPQLEEMERKQSSKSLVGKPAPELTMPGTDGKPLSISGFKGKYVLVDFWASWCRPCREENPEMVKLYQQYKDRGFEIFGVSLDESREQWLQAIEKDGLPWRHVSDLQGAASPAVQLYKVQAIPMTVILDKEGKILAKQYLSENR